MANSTKSKKIEKTNPMGKVLLISYNDAEFMKLCEENKGVAIVDTRKTGWSQNSAVSSEALAAKFGKRYFRKPELSLEQGMKTTEYLETALPVIEKIRQVVIAGYSVFITSWSPALLKILGALLLDGDRQPTVLLKWENIENKQAGLSVQRKLPREEIIERIEKYTNPMKEFSTKKEFDIEL